MRRTFRHSVLCLCAFLAASYAQTGGQQDEPGLTPREKMFLDRIEKLEQRLAVLEARQKENVAPAAANPSAALAKPVPPPAQLPGWLPEFFKGATVNLYMDGYYTYNFNRPVGRINVLRPYDELSNSFTLNQAGVVFERTPDLAEGRRLGLRLDFMYGEATAALGGSPANEPRPQIYPNIFQAFGAYMVPVGSGLEVDFGKMASPLGFEGTYTKDQINYSRSFLFTFLPFYHMGFRTIYRINSKVGLQYMLVNGISQTEDFNGFKSQHFQLVLKPAKSLSWTLNYYFGREQRDLVPLANPYTITLPVAQPGLSITPIQPEPNGRTHILDTYAVWNVTPKLEAVGEFDYGVSRGFTDSAPSHFAGGAGYLKYQFVPSFYLGGRFEYVSDRGGLLSGVSQALKEGTLTATWQWADAFQLRGEYRRDWSNQPFFLSHEPSVRKQQEDTATLGLIWWFGGRQGAW